MQEWEEGERRKEGRESSRTIGGERKGEEGEDREESNESTRTATEGGLFIGHTSERERASERVRELVHISWDRIS